MNTGRRFLRFFKRDSMRLNHLLLPSFLTRFTVGRISFRPFAALSFFAASCLSANANIQIIPTFDSSITSDPNAATIEAGIDQAISRFESSIENPISVSIDFQEMSSGLGASNTSITQISYSQYRSDLANNQILSANDMTALASLPMTSTNPVNGNANVWLTVADLRALQGGTPSGFDSTIGLNTSIMNLSRTGPQNPSFYDLQAVASHEIDEALGIGGSGSMIGKTSLGYPTGPVGSMDLFRYSGNGFRSYTTSTSATAYFSINGGTTNLTNFNQAGGVSDYGDWLGGSTPQVQDAFGTRDVDINLGVNELTALDVVGYNLVAVPEPGSGALLVGGLIAIGILRCRRKASSELIAS